MPSVLRRCWRACGVPWKDEAQAQAQADFLFSFSLYIAAFPFSPSPPIKQSPSCRSIHPSTFCCFCCERKTERERERERVMMSLRSAPNTSKQKQLLLTRYSRDSDDLLLKAHQEARRSPKLLRSNSSKKIAATSSLERALLSFEAWEDKVNQREAATKVQKVFKGHRTRRSLADCAIVVEELWWKLYDSASLDRTSISFFTGDKHQESAASRWVRAGKRIAKVGKGLCKDDKAQQLALRHWLEAIDPRHRYGHNLHLYYDIWFQSSSTQPFFYWLDIGSGRDIHHPKCPRNKLNSQLIMYLGMNERAAYQVVVDDGRLMYMQSGLAVNTTDDSKWIFVLSTTRSLYVGQKKKGQFQHSSFLAGAATSAAGRLVAKDGVLKAIWPYSGHYLPTQENFNEFIAFLQDNKVDLTEVKRCSVDDDEYPLPSSSKQKKEQEQEKKDNDDDEEEEGRRVMVKWTSGAGARIGCVRDYPAELQSKALEQVNLSPNKAAPPAMVSFPSPRPSPRIRMSPRVQQYIMGHHHLPIRTPTLQLTLPNNKNNT